MGIFDNLKLVGKIVPSAEVKFETMVQELRFVCEVKVIFPATITQITSILFLAGITVTVLIAVKRHSFLNYFITTKARVSEVLNASRSLTVARFIFSDPFCSENH